MNIAFALYDGFSMLEFSTFFDSLAQSGEPGLCCDICARSTDVYAAGGLHIYPTRIPPTLAGYDLVIIPGGEGAARHTQQAGLLAWLATACESNRLAASGAGVLLLAAAGLARERQVAALPEFSAALESFGALPVQEALLCNGPLATASNPAAAIELAARLREDLRARTHRIASDLSPIPVTGEKESQRGTGSPEPAGESSPVRPSTLAAPTRQASLTRQTGETQVEVRVDIDGTGRHQIATGLPFLDHMLAQIAVHGLFDLYIQAKGDLHIDPHHTVEDVALALGSAFQQALGQRGGIVRMASADCPMDESLAWAAVDFSGRPYSVIQVEWHGYEVGGLPVSLIAHFLESFALNARCNLHAAVRYGRDNHHQAEAIFKALGRAMCAATRIDPRRAGQVPSSKGILF